MSKPSHTQVGGDHYAGLAIQPSEFMYKNNLGWLEGNAIKYICRHQDKGGRQDIEKAIHYMELILEWRYGDDADLSQEELQDYMEELSKSVYENDPETKRERVRATIRNRLENEDELALYETAEADRATLRNYIDSLNRGYGEHIVLETATPTKRSIDDASPQEWDNLDFLDLRDVL